MNNLKAFRKSLEMNREFKEIYNTTPIISIYSGDDAVQVRSEFFHELVDREIIKITEKKVHNDPELLHLKGITEEGDIIVAVERKKENKL